MHRNSRLQRHALMLSTGLCLAFGLSPTLTAQSKSNLSADSSIPVTSSDEAAANEATTVHKHALFANTEKGRSATQARPGAKPANSAAATGTAAANVASNVFGFYPGDLVYMGGATVASAESNAIYVNSHSNTGGCKGVEQCWGDPEEFLEDLGRSTFIHVTDQYTGLATNGRYTVGDHAKVTVPSGTLLESDIVGIVHSVAAKKGSGYGHIYHVFLPPGTDTCFNDGTTCYSPDNYNTFYFCAYHGSVTFKDIGHVLFTVEPYQNVSGCDVSLPAPNGQLADSTNSVLSHETFETITDPDGTGWWNLTGGALGGEEIGDECVSLVDNTYAALDPTFLLHGHPYEVQLEYSNKYHACINIP